MQNAYSLSITQIVTHVHSSLSGLSVNEVKKRQQQHGLNILPEAKRLKVITLFISQFANTMVLLMLVAAGLSLLFDHLLDAVLISSMVIINAIMGFIQEFRAEQSIAALKKLLVTKVQVKRDDKVYEVSQDQLVVGDIILLQEGSRVPADARIINARNCYVSESVLTGESVPVEKTSDVISHSAELSDQTNMLWMGTTLTQGNVEAIVIAIGSQSQFGKIALDVSSVSTEPEHFSRKMTTLSKQMGTIALFSALATSWLFLAKFFFC
jgi:Ca2+-transporting ATPase